MANNETMINNNLLIEFIETCSINNKFTTLEKALCNKVNKLKYETKN